MAKDYEVRVFRQKEGQKRAGMWTFSVDGKPSLFYSSSDLGVWRKIRYLTNPRSRRGGVKISSLVASGSTLVPEGTGQRKPEPKNLEEFMKRGKLGLTEESEQIAE